MASRRIVIINMVWIAIIILILVACTNDQSAVHIQDNKSSTDDVAELIASTDPTHIKISLMLDRYPNAMHAFIYTAIANGYFLEKGIELDVRQPGEPSEGINLVGLGVVDLALSSQPQVLLSRAVDMPVVSIAAIVRHPLNYLMIPQSSVVQTPKNLAHRKVGYPGDGVSLAILKTMMRTDESDPDLVRLVNVKRDFVQSIASHRVDAIIGGNINEDRILLSNRMQPVRTIEPMMYGVPEYYEVVLITNENMIENKPELLVSIWEALARGQQDVVDNPEQAIELIMKKQVKEFPLNKQVEQESLNMLLPLMSNEDNEFGVQSKGYWSDASSWLDETGLMRKSVDSEDAYTDLIE